MLTRGEEAAVAIKSSLHSLNITHVDKRYDSRSIIQSVPSRMDPASSFGGGSVEFQGGIMGMI